MLGEKPTRARDVCLDDDFGVLSYGMDQAWLHAQQSGKALDFLNEQDALLQQVPLPDHFAFQRGIVLSKQQPSFVDSVKETIKRLRFLEKGKVGMPESVVGEICGGSMSYGRFFNVRGGESPSDIDLIMVVDTNFFASEEDQRAVICEEKGYKKEEAAIFQKRCAVFQELHAQGKAQMLSQKFGVEDYTVSLKVIPMAQFEWEFRDVPQQLAKERKDQEVGILDYKPAPYADKNSPRNNFYGQTHVFEGREEVLPNGEAITRVPVAVFKNGTFYTGDHHNHVIPKFEAMYDPKGQIKNVLSELEEILKSEYKKEPPFLGGQKSDMIQCMDRKVLLSEKVLAEARKRFAL